MARDEAAWHDPHGVGRRTRRVAVLDSWVDLFTVADFLDFSGAAVLSGEQVLVANHNTNSLALLYRSEPFARFYSSADRIFIDGTPVVWLARLAGADVHSGHRIAVLDWIWPMLRQCAAAGQSVVHLGSTEENIRSAREHIAEVLPELDITFVSGFFDMTDEASNRDVLAEVEAAGPHVLLVGMGMPRQEFWVAAHRAELPRCLIVTVGGALGYIGGDRPTPPRFLGALGVEWLYRLVTEPRRLWRRYLVEPWVLVRPIGRTVVRRWRRA